MYYNIDCIDGAKRYLSDDSVDLIITDPPYGINGDMLHKHYNRNESNVLDGYVEVGDRDYPEFSKKWIEQAARVLKPGGSLYIISGYTQLRHILNSLSDTKLKEVNHIIWKYNFGVYTSKKYISSHYHILYYVKPGGKPVFNTYSFFSDSEKSEDGGSKNYKDREDVWIINREYKPGEIKNKNELPRSLLTKMILYSSNPDDIVCDFFLGSFSTAKVSIGLGRKACGFEINPKAFEYQIEQTKSVKYGSLLASMRKPPANDIVNRGKPVLLSEANNIRTEFHRLYNSGETKKSAIEKVAKLFGRGYWSILKMVDGTANKSRSKQHVEPELFDYQKK